MGCTILGKDLGPLYQIAVSRDGRLLTSAGWDFTIRVFDLTKGEEVSSAQRPTRSRGTRTSPDYRTLASASDDATVRQWDVATRVPIEAVLAGHTDWVQCVAYSPDGRTLASASGHPGEERAVRLWNTATGLPRGRPLTGHGAMLTWVAFSPDGRYLASASHDGTVRIWDPVRLEPVRVLER